jgi:FlaA1/EpsC-like NDP-sugar epimerase
VVSAGSFYLAYEVRFDFRVPTVAQVERLKYIAPVVLLRLIGLAMAGQFGSMMAYFSVPDLLRLTWATTVCSLLMLSVRLPGFAFFMPPRGVLLTDYLFCLLGLGAVRLAIRIYRERLAAAGAPDGRAVERVAIVGAGDAGAALARDFINAPHRGFKPIAFLDDDPRKLGKYIHGVPVLGPPETSLTEIVAEVSKIVIAMPKASAKRVREVVMIASRYNLPVETVPSWVELASGSVRTSKIRPVDILDLLGRTTVELDPAPVRALFTGKTVLVTGAGGSIGAELCRQIARLGPSRLILVEQSEGSLFAIEQELGELGFGTGAVFVVGNVLDAARMDAVFERYSPEVVFHAAAHKHVFMMERQPSEALINNVLGTRRLAELAIRSKVERFILVSTDKAINPTSVMGATKRLAEIQLQQLAAGRPQTKLMAVRFGNVLGSSGSVIPIFRRQIANGGPVTVTHPEVTRYFMTIPEAVGLVLQSALLGEGGEIFVLDMGQPVKIADLARQMIELSGLRVGDDIEIKFTGLKPGEKLYEEVRHDQEDFVPTSHSKVLRFIAKSDLSGALINLDPAALHELEGNEVKRFIMKYVPEYNPYID